MSLPSDGAFFVCGLFHRFVRMGLLTIVKKDALQWLTQRHSVSFAGAEKSAELALNSLMDELDQNDEGLSAEQAMKIALKEVGVTQNKTP